MPHAVNWLHKFECSRPSTISSIWKRGRLRRGTFKVHSETALHAMPTLRNPVANFTVETLIAFIGALLVLPLLFKVVVGTLRGLLRLAFVRRLILDSLIVGATALLTREDVLDRVFGARQDGHAKRPEAHAGQVTKG